VRIALIDYRAGNLTSVKKAFAAIGHPVYVPARPAGLAQADAVVVPGVGHFGATRALTPDWVAAVRSGVDAGRPLLGICLGLQWLFEGSDEEPGAAGLGLLPGRCYRLGGRKASNAAPAIKVPHVGWNALSMVRRDAIVAGVGDGAQVYFTHSFVAPVTADTVATTEHGEVFASIVQRGRVAGVQFHPEKSGDVGLRILRNFVSFVSSVAS
jgi:imidazole glycerol-phosphate synthase subunit HisH